MHGLIGRKIGMVRFFDKENGEEIPVTVVETGTNVVHQVKTGDKDGYRAVQLGFGIKSERRVNKPMMGHFAKHKSAPSLVIKEFKLDSDDEQIEPGQRVGVEVFENIKYVDVTGITKGRGFSGWIKRHNFRRGPKSHGSKNVREQGSSGPATYPARVFPGLKMPGQYGNCRRTIKNLQLVGLEKEAGLMFIRGAIPGRTRGIVFVNKAGTN